ncbi:MAG TPA: N-acetyl-gamma-glutamyl-phosphate reductase [Thermoanaerobaculia bacterium]
MNEQHVAVVGATGYSGAELTAILAKHRFAEIAVLFSGSESGAVPFDAIHPSLAGCDGPNAQPFDSKVLFGSGADVVFLATPNELSAQIAPLALQAKMRVIDLSGAYRLADARAYPAWYGFEHPAPELLESAVYGLTEWCDGELDRAKLVANPGCYPTSILLALKPLAPMLAHDQPIVCDSKSGVSGAGKKKDLAYSFAELSGNFKAYGIGKHRHEPEIRQELGLNGAPFTFVPHLLPTVRGILSTMYVSFAEPQTETSVREAFAAKYAEAPFVRVRKPGDLPELKQVVGTPRADIGFVLLDAGKRAVVVSAIDNLLKGAASQAIQNFNRMSGIDEREGLER